MERPTRFFVVPVVTGCTRGMGRAYVDELARRKMDIVLVGRSLSALKAVAAEVGKIFFFYRAPKYRETQLFVHPVYYIYAQISSI